ncbi:hypothetical protein BV22DRAFT_1039779 [Leucogyrophana mollusca]|uniref:Uncharacterized protein n=1 Tax=Leucogyrophana mollusca TaxID=85980 RepID=A0ACB8B6W7_9AGAM|nr:hypothetical protein BV22DRAFT_1039779 [Leucogyrophana mollusca]
MSDLIHELFVIRSADYLSMALATAVAYDQLLNFSQEVDLIWNRRWSIVTLLYLLARYCGSLSVIGGMESSTGIGWTTAR